MGEFVKGQRWISEMEPELGMGTITSVERRRIHVSFHGTKCERQYATAAAPLKRVKFRPGDEIKSRSQIKICIEIVRENKGLLIYYGNGYEFSEYDLCDTISFSTPKERLANGLVDSNRAFNLRCTALDFRARTRNSAVRGFTGGRVDLIPHQFYIAGEVSSRQIPQVLLSDEVGLGKTIEACLILHRLLLCERISRVLIIVPESLVHQWFVELWRRFNLLFRIFDEEFCLSAEKQDPETNPFGGYQLGICSMVFFNSNRRKKQALEAGWDMLVVDEAHHIVENSPEYKFTKAMGKTTRGLMLLTATPEQLGERSHFSHLRLLDPARYYNFNAFLQNTRRYHKTAGIIDKIIRSSALNNNEMETTAFFLGYRSKEDRARFNSLINGSEDDRKQLIDEVLDRHGAGRVIFRNTRAVIKGFPHRMEKLYPLEGTKEDIRQINRELEAEINGSKNSVASDYTNDPRITFLVNLLQSLKGEKILLICGSLDRSLAIETAVRKQVNAKIALFNEKMTLIQRDRSAAWFSEKNGAQLMICSEIGSEGRNFQFARHLVMFDFPLNPELLEQRIGRLDRIGQTSDISIHVPYVKMSACEIIVKWYKDGLEIFKNNVNGVHHIFTKFEQRVTELAMERINGGEVPESVLAKLLKETEAYRRDLAKQLEKGRDRLVELNSFRPGKAKKLTGEIESIDNSLDIDNFMLRIFNHYGIQAEESWGRTYRLHFKNAPGPEFPVPALRENPMAVTFDRKTALCREDIDFLSWDNPMVTGSMELLLGTQQGNTSLAVWKDSDTKGILLEAFFVLECIAPSTLHIDRFLPAEPVRIVVDHLGRDVTSDYPFGQFEKSLENFPGSWLSKNPEISGVLLPEMINNTCDMAKQAAFGIMESGVSGIESSMGKEIRRLKDLRKVNPGIRAKEIELMAREMEALCKPMLTARFRLDALRAVVML